MNKSIKKTIAAFTAVFTMSASLIFAEGVNRDEIKTIAGQTIVFESYTGPHIVVDTLEQIKGIGTDLGKDFERNIAGNKGNPDRYYIIHAVDEKESGKLDADILVIGKNASVDHIRNLRHIVASYLSKAYDYGYDDAYTLATFITVYNAVYRGNIDYFNQKYKNVVTKNLESGKAGIAISYKEWPGATQLVIPIGELNGGLSTVDTSVISDKKVVESMQEEDNKGIDERKNLVDIKEREAEKAQEKAQEAQKTATIEERKLVEDKKELADKKAEAAEKEKTAVEAQKLADDAQAKAAENPNDKAAQKEAVEAKQFAEEAKKESETAKEEVKKSEEKVEQQTAKTEEAKQTAAEEQAKADKKQTEAQTERKEIAKDQKEVIANNAIEEATAIFALKLVDSKNLYSAITKVNRLTGEELKTSPVKVIRNRTIYNEGTNFVAIAGETGKTSAIKLVQIDRNTLEIVKESDEVISENSVLLQAGSTYIAVINDNGKAYVGKFNSDLQCTVKSPVEVNPATPIIISAEGFCVTDKGGKVILLNANDLTKKEQTTAGKAVNTVKQVFGDDR